MKTIIHVAQDAIRRNMKLPSFAMKEPAIIVRRGSTPTRHHKVEICDADGKVVGTFHYSPDKPLACGARVWLELSEGCYADPV